MQTLTIGQTTRVFLNTSQPVDAVTFSLVDDQGQYAKDSSGNDLSNKSTALDVTSKLYYFDVTLFSSTVEGDFRIYWTATNSSIVVQLEDQLNPEDAIVRTQIDTSTILVSPTYVLDNYLRGIDIKTIEEKFVGFTYRETIRTQIRAATHRLQRRVDTYFTPTIITKERHDYFIEPLNEHFWAINVLKTPLISIEAYQFSLNERKLADVPTTWIQTGNKFEGRVKILPSDTAEGFAIKIISEAGLGLALILGGAYHVPDFFEIDYTAGLEWSKLSKDEKEDIKLAIGRNVAIHMLPNLDIHRGLGGESKSVDGASVSKQYTASAMYFEHSAALKEYKIAENKWVDLFKRDLGKRLIVEGYTG